MLFFLNNVTLLTIAHNSRLNTVLLSMDVLGFVKILKQESIMEKQILLSHLKCLEEMLKAFDALPEDMKESCYDALD